MTQTTSGHPQFDRLEQDLENWRDQLAQLSPYLSQSDLAKLARRWDLMRQNLDTTFLNYGHPLPKLPMAMDGLPPLMDLLTEELEITAEALQNAKKTLTGYVSESQQRVSLLEQVLNSDQKPARVKKILEKMRGIDEGLQVRLQALVTQAEHSKASLKEGETLLQTTHYALEQSKRIEGISRANQHLEGQRREMAHWLDESKQRLRRLPMTPPPTAGSLGLAGLSIAPRNDGDKALELLFSSREKLREARRYLENVLGDKEETR